MTEAPGPADDDRRGPAYSTEASPRLVFVTGASRSGTTMLSRVLGNHSLILALNELHFFGDLCTPSTIDRRLDPPDVTRLVASLLVRHEHGLWPEGRPVPDNDRVRRICEVLRGYSPTAAQVFNAVCADQAISAGKPIVCEQTPRNIFYAQIVLKTFPSAKIVHLVRDPRAVAASQKNRWKLRRLGADRVPRSELFRTWVNYHPVTMAKLWTHATMAAESVQGHPRVRIVQFEDLARYPSTVVPELCRFLDIDFQPSMLDVPQWGSSNLRHDQKRGGISTEVIDRWTAILGKGEVRLIERIAGELMAHFGYQSCEGKSRYSGLLALRYLATYPFHSAGVVLTNPRRAWIQFTAMFSGQHGDG